MRNLNESLGLIEKDFVPGQLAGCQSVAADPPDWNVPRTEASGVNYSKLPTELEKEQIAQEITQH